MMRRIAQFLYWLAGKIEPRRAQFVVTEICDENTYRIEGYIVVNEYLDPEYAARIAQGGAS